MNRGSPLLACSAVLLTITSCSTESHLAGTKPLPSTGFPSHDGEIPPATEYRGPLFQLSAEYPDLPPESQNEPWLDVDPMADPDAYLLVLRDYFFEGMIEADFRAQDNEVRTWYHVPWMHVGDNPREAIRGLTSERASRCKELGPTQTKRQQNWGIGFYNPAGGFTVGQVWADHTQPDAGRSQFLEGTVVAKLLFSDAPDSQVPHLAGAPVWTAYIKRAFPECGHREQGRAVRQVRLLQMDVAVKDSRAGVTGWFFGSLVYEGSALGEDPWKKVVPGGLQWGPDHGYGRQQADDRDPLKETYMSDPQPVLSTFKEELGWLGRLNGPIDNSASSCMSCHSTAQWPVRARLVPKPEASETDRMRWFRPLAGHEAFSEGATALDYSLQIGLSLENFKRYGNAGEPERSDAEARPGGSHELAR